MAIAQPRLHHPDWRGPILLLAGTLDEDEATKLVQLIWKKDAVATSANYIEMPF